MAISFNPSGKSPDFVSLSSSDTPPAIFLFSMVGVAMNVVLNFVLALLFKVKVPELGPPIIKPPPLKILIILFYAINIKEVFETKWWSVLPAINQMDLKLCHNNAYT